MTHPHDPRVCPTNGIGNRCTSHLNLDRSLADVWQTSERARHAAKIQWAKRRAEIARQYQALPPPYAGYDRTERAL